MKTRLKRLGMLTMVFLFLAAVLSGGNDAVSEADEAMIEAFFANPNYIQPKLSPDGRHLAAITYHKGRRSVMVMDLGDLAIRGMTVPGGHDVNGFDWIDNDQILFHVSKWEIYTVGLYVYSVSKKRIREVVDATETDLIFREVVETLPDLEDRVVISASDGNGYGRPNLYLLDVGRNAHPRKLVEHEGMFSQFVVDSQGRPRYAVGRVKGMGIVSEIDPETLAVSESKVIERGFIPIGILPGDEYMLTAVTNLEGFTGLTLLNLESGELSDDVRYVPGYDMLASGASVGILDNLSGRLMGVKYHRAKPANFWFDRPLQEIEGQLRGIFKDHIFDFLGYDPAAKALYVEVSSDVEQPVILRIDLEKGDFSAVVRRYLNLPSLSFRPMHPVSFTSGGDGGPRIHGYLTRPEGEGPFPTVLLIHGGPMVRDTWGFDRQVQFLALNGFAVLQVNYRGSTGYGSAHQMSGLMEVADASVDDVIAAARWAIDQGVADPEHIGIMGGSFGAYISTAAAARAPKLFAAVVGMAGLYDFVAIYKQDNRRDAYWTEDFFSDFDEATYRAMSPVNLADQIEAPVLIVHGKNDMRVNFSQAKDMMRALKKSDKQVDLLYIGWGVHGFPDENDRVRTYSTILSFLRRHLQPAE